MRGLEWRWIATLRASITICSCAGVTTLLCECAGVTFRFRSTQETTWSQISQIWVTSHATASRRRLGEWVKVGRKNAGEVITRKSMIAKDRFARPTASQEPKQATSLVRWCASSSKVRRWARCGTIPSTSKTMLPSTITAQLCWRSLATSQTASCWTRLNLIWESARLTVPRRWEELVISQFRTRNQAWRRLASYLPRFKLRSPRSKR